MPNSFVFPSRQVEMYGGGGCPFLCNRGLNRLRRRLGGLGGWRGDWFRLPGRSLRWWCSWLGRARAISAGGVLEFRQPLQPNLSKPCEYFVWYLLWIWLPCQHRLGGLDLTDSDSDRSSWWSSRLSARGLKMRGILGRLPHRRPGHGHHSASAL